LRTSLEEPKTIFVTGMPRGGTTIVAKVFNSYEDGICLGEPHWYYNQRGSMNLVRQNCTGKVKDIFDAESPDDIIPWCQRTAGTNGYNLVGFKETWFFGWEVPRLTKKWKTQVDYCVVVFRDPVRVHSSQRALVWDDKRPVLDFRKEYRQLDRLAQQPNATGIGYELFSRHGLDYLNYRLPFSIEGPLDLQPTGHEYGDPYANRCTDLRVTNREILVTPQEIKGHQESIDIWLKWSNL
jgi:hypothetical protein